MLTDNSVLLDQDQSRPRHQFKTAETVSYKDRTSNSWCAMRSGKKFYPDDPQPDQFDLEDIAAGLATLRRFGGQTSEFYSVAQHSVLTSKLVPHDEFRLEALLHDAGEFLYGDVPTPAKAFLPDFCRLEEKLIAVIRFKFGLPAKESFEVREADKLALVTEAEQFQRYMPSPAGGWWRGKSYPRPRNMLLLAERPVVAYEKFLNACNTEISYRRSL